MPIDEERKSDPRIHITRVQCGDARTEIETFDWDDRAVLRIIGGNGWTWLDPASRLAVAAAILPAGSVAIERRHAQLAVTALALTAASCPDWIEDGGTAMREASAAIRAVLALQAGEAEGDGEGKTAR